MTPATRETLGIYAVRMGRSLTSVLREFRAESKTKQGVLLTEMRRVEGEFLKYQAKLEAKLEAKAAWRRVLLAPFYKLARAVGRGLARMARL